MKPMNRVLLGVATAGLIALTPFAEAANSTAKDAPAALQAQAKVTEADARATALSKVPNGAVKSSNLEKERGRLVWSFDISKPDSKDITEVQVDAVTGKIVAVEMETPAKEASEAQAKPANK
jgi:uncharacterized membrane protein YkoI